jgi:hypothetical protein
MTSSNTHDPAGAGSSDDLKGLEILLVEDSWVVGKAMKDLLELLGADVVGPAGTSAEAERLLSEQTPDIALVDFHLRGGECMSKACPLSWSPDHPSLFRDCRWRPRPSWRSPSAKHSFSRACARCLHRRSLGDVAIHSTWRPTNVGPASNGYCLPGVDALQNGTEAVKGERRAKAVSRLASTPKPPHRGRRVIHRARIASGMRRW